MLMHSHKNLTVLHFLGGDDIRQILWKFSSLLRGLTLYSMTSMSAVS